MNIARFSKLNKIVFKNAWRQMAIIGVFVFVIAFCLNILFIYYSDYRYNFYEKHIAQNAEHNFFIFSGFNPKNIKKNLKEILSEKNYVTDYEMSDTFAFYGNMKYIEGEYAYNIFFLDKLVLDKNKIGKINIIKEDSSIRGIYCPYSFLVNDAYHIGDEITINSYGNIVLKFKVKGFYYESVYSLINGAATGFILDHDEFMNLYDEFGVSDVILSIKVKDPNTFCKLADTEIPNELLLKSKDATCFSRGIYTNMEKSRYGLVEIYLSLILSTAIIIIIISSIIIVFNITNFIKNNMNIFGILKAIGYKSKNIKFAVIFTFQNINVLVIVISLITSNMFFTMLNHVFERQTGIPYDVKLSIKISFIIILIVFVITLFFIIYAVKDIKTITPVMAINMPANAKKGAPKKYKLSVSEHKLNYAIALLNISTHKKQANIIAITTGIAMFVLTFSIIVYRTFIIDKSFLINMSYGVKSDVQVVISSLYEDKLMSIINDEKDVTNCLNRDTKKMVIENGNTELFISVIDDTSDILNRDWCCEGRFPNNKNEIAIGTFYARNNNIKIDDYVNIVSDLKTNKYRVTGFIQSLEVDNGRNGIMTRTGYERFDNIYIYTYLISLKDGVNRKTFIEKLKQQLPTVLAIDMNEFYNGAVYSQFISGKVIITFLIAISFMISIIIIFQMTLVMLSARKKNYGIMKALGYSSNDLIIQTILSTILPVVLSIIIAAIFACIISSPFVNMILYISNISISHIRLIVPKVLIIFGGTCVLLILFIFGAIVSRKYIVKIKPQELITME